MLGPVAILQVKGAICPCLTSPQETETSKALSKLSNLPIQYSTYNSSDNANCKGVGKIVSSLFSNAAAVVSDGSSTSSYKRGRMNVVDSMRGPLLSFISELQIMDEENIIESERKINDKDENLTIALKRIGDIEANNSFVSSSDAGIVVYKNLKGTKFSSGEKNEVTAEERDDVIEYLKIIVEWDRSRRKMDPNTASQEDDNDEATNDAGNGIGQRALKAKYFIQKEIEMKKQMKDRESRKAKYMKGSGGLKYTALAMANREMT